MPFTIPLPWCGRNPATVFHPRIFDRVWAERITGIRGVENTSESTLKLSPIVNAFLTLSAVTKW
jgi:hypothetical protein